MNLRRRSSDSGVPCGCGADTMNAQRVRQSYLVVGVAAAVLALSGCAASSDPGATESASVTPVRSTTMAAPSSPDAVPSEVAATYSSASSAVAVVAHEGPRINWDLPYGERATIADIATALSTAPGLTYRPFDPEFGQAPALVQRDGESVVAVYRFPSGGNFRTDGRLWVQQSKAEGGDEYLQAGEPGLGGAVLSDLVSETIQIRGHAARVLVNTRRDVARLVVQVDGVRVDITGPDAPPAAVLDAAQRVLSSPRLGPASVGSSCPPVPPRSVHGEALVALLAKPQSDFTVRRQERFTVVPYDSTERLVASADVAGVVKRESSGPQVTGFGTTFVAIAPGSTTVAVIDSHGVTYRVLVRVVC